MLFRDEALKTFFDVLPALPMEERNNVLEKLTAMQTPGGRAAAIFLLSEKINAKAKKSKKKQ